MPKGLISCMTNVTLQGTQELMKHKYVALILATGGSDMVRAALKGKWEKARELHYRLLHLMNINFIESNPIPAKAALHLMGMIENQLRLPLMPLSEANRQKIEKTLRELHLLQS